MKCVRGCTYPDSGEAMPALVGKLCSQCATTIRNALRAIPDLAAHAFDNGDGKLTPGRESTDTTRHALNADPPSPSPALDLVDEVRQWLFRMAEACADATHTRPPFRYRPDWVPRVDNTAALAGYVIDNLSWFAFVIPTEIYDEATGWRRQLERMTGRDRLIHRIKTPCSRCNQRTLTREDGADMVVCRNDDCRARWDIDDPWFAHITAS